MKNKKIIFILAIIAIFVMSVSVVEAWCFLGFVGNSCGIVAKEVVKPIVCGDGICSSGENIATCPRDCINAEEPIPNEQQPVQPSIPTTGNEGSIVQPTEPTIPTTGNEGSITQQQVVQPTQPSTPPERDDTKADQGEVTGVTGPGITQPTQPREEAKGGYCYAIRNNQGICPGELDIQGNVDIKSNDNTAVLSVIPGEWNSEGDSAKIQLGDLFHSIKGEWGWNSGGLIFNDNTAFRFKFFDNNNEEYEAVTINRRDNQLVKVGIGTSNPSRTLDVKGNAIITGDAIIGPVVAGGAGSNGMLNVFNNINDESLVRMTNLPEGNSDSNSAGFLANAKGMNVYMKAYSIDYADENKRHLAEIGTVAGGYAPLAINVGGSEVARFHPVRADNQPARIELKGVVENPEGDFIIRLS